LLAAAAISINTGRSCCAIAALPSSSLPRRVNARYRAGAPPSPPPTWAGRPYAVRYSYGTACGYSTHNYPSSAACALHLPLHIALLRGLAAHRPRPHLTRHSTCGAAPTLLPCVNICAAALLETRVLSRPLGDRCASCTTTIPAAHRPMRDWLAPPVRGRPKRLARSLLCAPTSPALIGRRTPACARPSLAPAVHALQSVAEMALGRRVKGLLLDHHR
jgi:hypothetical protein